MVKKYLKWTIVVIAVISVILNLLAFSGKVIPKKDAADDKHILVEIYEVPEYANKGIHIHFGNENYEYIPFHEFDRSNHAKNGNLIISTINRLEGENYSISHVSSGVATNGMITKIFMVKQ